MNEGIKNCKNCAEVVSAQFLFAKKIYIVYNIGVKEKHLKVVE